MPLIIIRFFLFSRPRVYNDPPDTVILCGIPRGPAAPSFSMFPIKLETYLRLAKIPHKASNMTSKHNIKVLFK